MPGLLRSNILLTSRGRRFRRLVAKIFNLDSSSGEHSKSEWHYHMETKPHARVKTIKATSTCPELFNLFQNHTMGTNVLQYLFIPLLFVNTRVHARGSGPVGGS